MSYSTLLALYPGEKFEEIRELRNGWGSAPIVWDSLCKKYLNGARWMIDREAGGLWNLWTDDRIPVHLRAVLLMTFDRAYIAKKDYARAAADIEKFLEDFPEDNRVNHWPEIAALLKSDPEYPAFGIHCTSVSENPFQGPWDEETEEYGPTRWESCFNIYEALE